MKAFKQRAAASAASLLLFSPVANAAGAEQPAEVDSFPIVLTPTRLKQSLQDVPASVSIITADTLRKFNITSIPDALRLVPGMSVNQASGPDYRVNYHGTNGLSPRRMNVQIDGVSVYQPLFARVDWASLPIAIEDIERIEVTRGPNSAAYGPNSLMAIVNIISKNPSDVEAAFVSVTQGANGLGSYTARFGRMVGNTAVRLTANQDRDGGFDFLERAKANHDSTRVNRLNLRAQTEISSATKLDVNAAYLHGVREIPSVDAGGVTFPDAIPTTGFLSTTLTHVLSEQHELQASAYIWKDKIKQEWLTCYPTALFLPELFNLYRANPAYAASLLAGRLPSGGSPADDALAAAAASAIAALGPRARQPTCATANQNLDQRRIDFEVQDTYVQSEHFRLVAGMGYRRHDGSGRSYLGPDSVSNHIWRVFGNAEFKPTHRWSFNVGGYHERDNFIGSSFSPRLGANFRLSDLQSVRVGWSKATRTPDIQEQQADWQYSSNDATPPLNGSSTVRLYQSARSPGGLDREKLESWELGYVVNVPTLGMIFDAKLFRDELTDLISEKLQLADFRPTNNGRVKLQGFELQLNMALAVDWTLFGTYAHLRNYDASNVLEQTQYSRHSGSIGVWHAFGNGWSGSTAYYGASGEGLGQRSFGRLEASVTKAVNVGGTDLSATLGARRLDKQTQTYFRDFGAQNTLRASYDQRYQVIGSIRVSF